MIITAKLKYLSLFSGIGGFELGIQNSDIEMECVGYAEIDKYAKSIYQRHYPNHFDWGDVREIRTDELPDFDFMVGGFPCQSFSHAGSRRGFDDTRGTLFFEIARILKDKRPRYFLLENVKGLLSHNKGETFKRILEILANLGYNVKWQIYSSQEVGGVPQKRERVYIKGYSRRECGGEVLFEPREYGEINSESIDESIKIIGNFSPSNHHGRNVYSVNGLAPTLCSTSLYKNGLNILEKKDRSYLKIKETTKKGYKEAYPYDGVLLNRIGRKIIKGAVQSDATGTLSTQPNWGTVTEDYWVRRLTPIECERLQAFPDDWTRYGVDGEEISNTQRYKCLGNAVTTSVVTYIINRMFKYVE